MFNNLTNYQDSGIQIEREAQILSFNRQFETYNRKDVRGSDIISLMNRIVDYNKRRTGETSEERFQEMNIRVKMGNKSQLESEFSYDNQIRLLETEYTQRNIENFINSVKAIESKYQQSNVTKLVTNITKVIDGNIETISQIIPPSFVKNNRDVEDIKKATLSYYEYSLLKRAYFNCTNVRYNLDTGRIIEMEFERISGKFN